MVIYTIDSFIFLQRVIVTEIGWFKSQLLEMAKLREVFFKSQKIETAPKNSE